MHGYSLLMEEDGGIRATKLCAWLTVFFFLMLMLILICYERKTLFNFG
jgi:hypothetical protein